MQQKQEMKLRKCANRDGGFWQFIAKKGRPYWQREERYRLNWYLENGKDSDIVISSRIRLARNIKEFPFKIKMTKEDKNKLLEKVKFITPSIGYGLKFLYLKDMDDITKMSLVEKHILSPEMALKKEQDGAILIND